MPKKSFAESFQELIYKRLEYNDPDLCNNPEYKTLICRAIELDEKIMELLGPENKHLIFEADEIDGLIAGLCGEHAYKSGFREALEFKQVINAMGIPFQKEACCEQALS